MNVCALWWFHVWVCAEARRRRLMVRGRFTMDHSIYDEMGLFFTQTIAKYACLAPPSLRYPEHSTTLVLRLRVRVRVSRWFAS
eukprot:1430085-Rhodomonas_salina.1